MWLNNKRLFEQLINNLRIGLARHCFHRLTDKEAEQRLLAASILFDFVSVRRENICDYRLNRTRIARLLQALFFNDLCWIIPGFEHDFKHLL